jgi:rubrerythrin
MIEGLIELLDIALDREIVSQVFYTAGQKKTRDPGAITLMKELASEEQKHYMWIKSFRDSGLNRADRFPQKLPDMKISEYQTDPGISEGAGLQEVLIAAMKREQYSMEFYTEMDHLMLNEAGHQLCRKLILAEEGHKARLEELYETLFLKEN